MSNTTPKIEPTTKLIVLWGTSQAGKTTALASYFCRHPSPSWVAPGDAAGNAPLNQLRAVWTELMLNRLPWATVNASHYNIRHTNGTILQFRDMRGGYSDLLTLSDDDSRALQDRADAVLVFARFNGPKNDAIAAMNAIQVVRAEIPLVLVLTKAECVLGLYELNSFNVDPLKFATHHTKVDHHLMDLIQAATDRRRKVFAVSAFGYKDRYPAHYRDEFGRIVPWNIQSEGITEPFDAIVEALTKPARSWGTR